ncbi:PCMD domain-containing protein [Myroides sp.]|uniref:PCMD domain-containing protein n=1 Tax=Myroides sp. TaxID=1874736 RepID=UPI0028AD6FE9|nr:PCMD domain-containing protein [Myroides sp.]
MRINYLLFALLTTIGITFSSCIKDEALSQKAEILEATAENADIYISSISKKSNEIIYYLKQNSPNNIYAPVFTISKGSKIIPASGTLLNFENKEQKYTVYSEDGNWEKVYTVKFIKSDFVSQFSFENTVLEGDNSNEPYSPDKIYKYDTYFTFFEYLSDNQTDELWQSGNPGYSIFPANSLKVTNPSQYPTTSIKDGYKGKGLKLETVLTGLPHSSFIPGLAAGNIFLGNFDTKLPAIKSTEFGIPYTTNKQPKAVTGYFKYKPGKDFIINEAKDNKISKDTWDAYAILFEKKEIEITGPWGGKEKVFYLPGDHNFKDDRMVMMARIDESQRIETDNWTRFEMPFKSLDGKKFDPKKQYMIAIVLTSSYEGNIYNGAVGSTLLIDEIEITFEANNDIN